MIILFLLLLAHTVTSLNNGLALTPPMGWRSWNCFHGSVTDKMIREVVDALTKQRPLPTSFTTTTASFKDLGYNHVGVDDGWQECGAGPHGSFHSADGTPLLNTTSFPRPLKSLVDYGHSKGLYMGWYHINCICMDTYTLDANRTWANLSWDGNVKQMLEAGFDGVKIDNCGDDDGTGYEEMVRRINVSGRPLMIENSNQAHGRGPPRGLPVNRTSSHNDNNGSDWCGFNMFRTGGDIQPSFDDVMLKLQTTRPFQSLFLPVSRPSCWAYPDMLQTGNFPNATQGGNARYFVESRAHFGAWCVVSSPLILGLDVRDEERVAGVWEILSNVEAIAINQAWAGHPGRLVREVVDVEVDTEVDVQIWAKKVDEGGSQAVLVINRGEKDMNGVIVFTLDEIGLVRIFFRRLFRILFHTFDMNF